MKKPKISIIVPVYNAEKYLRQCLDSILNQSFNEFELLLIDDGSTDQSGNICDEYAEKDKRVQVFHQANQGVSVARNLGLVHAQGEWIYFSDSDDIVMTDAFSIMESMIEKNIDYIMCGYEVYDERAQCTYTISTRKQKIIDKYAALMEMFAPMDYRYQGYLWNKMFKLSIIKENNLSFVQGIKFNEDRLFNVSYLCHITNNVAYTTTPVYQYIESSTSVMASLKKCFNPAFITDLDAFVMMRKALTQANAGKKLLKAHAHAMYNSANWYYSMSKQFEELSLSKIYGVEKRLMQGIGIIECMNFRIWRLGRKIYKLCKNS